MSISLIQKSASAAAGGSPFTVTLSNTTAGNSIVLVITGRSFSGTSASDGINTYSSTSIFTNGGDNVQFFYVLNGAGNVGTLTISVSASSLTNIYVNAREYHSGVGTLQFDAVVGTATPTNTATPTGDAPTLSGSNDVLIGGMTDFNALGSSVGSGWANFDGNTNTGAIICDSEDLLNTGTGQGAIFNLTSSQSDWMVATLALKEPAGAATNNPIVGMRSFLTGGHR